MSLQSIEEEGKKADELWEKTYGNKKPDGDGEGKTDDTDSALDLEPKPDEKKPDKKVDVKKDEPKDEPKEEDYKHKYEVLKGKYDAEVPRLAFDLAETTKGIGELKREIEELKKPKAEPKPIPKPEEVNPVLKKFKDEYPEVYEGTSSLIDELVKEKLSGVDKKIDEKIVKVEEGIGTVKAESDRERYLSKLDTDEAVGKEWREINKNPEFNKWLEEIEPYTGLKKYDLLMDSWNKMEPVRTLGFFKDFKGLKKASIPEDKKEDEKPNVKDEDIHPPKGQKGSDVVKKGEGDIVTPEMLRQFTKDVIDGKWKGREADADKEHDRLIKALIKPRQT